MNGTLVPSLLTSMHPNARRWRLQQPSAKLLLLPSSSWPAGRAGGGAWEM